MELAGLTDEDVRQTMLRALRLLAIIAVAGVSLAWWKLGWQSALLLAVGAVISATGLWEWMRLMAVVISRMDAGAEPRPVGTVLVGFFMRLGIALVALYVSLKYLDGSVYALAAGLALGMVALTIEALRLVRSWTV
ncbi:MAG TPA: ATP synthase subunit I [Acidobacteriaceae bacterium]|nr:ATP synthase subunit I [Acidobacteriaceae bacterium]